MVNVMLNNNILKDKDIEYKVYFEERKLLTKAELEGSRLFDKAILTLAAGSFGLSLAFIKQLLPSAGPKWSIFLISSWVSFGLSILSTLISFLTSQSACSEAREILEKKFFNNSNIEAENYKRKNKSAVWTKRLNWFSIIAFIIGVFCLAIFIIINFLK
jgi:hypothetical protein